MQMGQLLHYPCDANDKRYEDLLWGVLINLLKTEFELHISIHTTARSTFPPTGGLSLVNCTSTLSTMGCADLIA